MATGKRFYWIKLRQDFMTGDTIDFLMSQKDGANYVVLYQMLCLMVANTNGSLCKQVGEVLIPYDIDRIKRDCKYFDRDTVIVAMELFKKLGLVYESDEGIMQITHFNEMVGSTSDYAEQKRNQRLSVDNVHSMSTKMSIQSKSIDIDKELDIDKDKELNKNIELNKNNNIYGVKSTRFVPPTVDEIKEYCLERNNNVDAEKFYDFYQAKGWMVGKNKMKDWKAAIRTWENRDKKPSNQPRDIFKELRDC